MSAGQMHGLGVQRVSRVVAARTAAPPALPPTPLSRLRADLLANFTQHRQLAAARAVKGVVESSEHIGDASIAAASAPAGAASALSCPAPSALAHWAATQELAHCLVFDTARFPADGDEMQQLQSVFAADASSEVVPQLLRWLPALEACDVA